MIAAEIRVFPVTFIARQPEMLAGEAADFLNGCQFFAQSGIRGGIREQGRDGFALGKDFPLAADCLLIEADGLAGIQDHTAKNGEEMEEAAHGSGRVSHGFGPGAKGKHGMTRSAPPPCRHPVLPNQASGASLPA